MFKTATLLALPLLAACATAGAGTVRLEGSKWAFTAIDGARPVSSRAELTIDKGRIGANLGCNGLGGDAVITPDRLMVSGVISTMMYCDGVMAQERAVSDLLGASPSYTVKNDVLVLRGKGHTAELKRVAS